MRTVILDGCCMQQKEEAHAYLKEQLQLPDYYGNNLDALYDCLTESGEIKIVFENWQQETGYLKKIARVFAEAAKENTDLILQKKRK